MESRKPLIFISNDDGVAAKGINELIKFLQPLGEIVVMAPDSPRSGSACALTVADPIHYKLIQKQPDLTVYQCSGTPVDCLKLALHTVLPRIPDLVVSGINHGDNSAVSVHYSGTMGVAIEGCLKGIPSIGFSLCDHSTEANFEVGGKYIYQIASQVLKNGLPSLICLNVNIPSGENLKGIKICQQGKGTWVNEWEKISRQSGTHYYWLTGEFKDDDMTTNDDRQALKKGFVAVTPITVDVTAHHFIKDLTTWF